MRFHARAVVVACALLLGCVPVLAGDRALLVGINDYKDPGINDLRGPLLDVAMVHSLLLNDFAFKEDQIMVLTESRATRGAVLEAISSWLIAGTKSGDRIFLYFSGHGAQVTIPDGNGTRLTTGLVPYDTSRKVSSTATKAGGLILGSQLGALVRKMKGREVTIVVDACHSGSLTRGVDDLAIPAEIKTITPNGPIELEKADITDELIAESKTGVRLLDFNARGGEPMEGVAVWSAATIAQYSWDSSNGGIFTNAFVHGLHDRQASATSDGRVTASALLAHVRRVANAFCSSYAECKLGFTPELLAPDSYRAKLLAPYATVTPPVADTPPPVVNGPELVDLAQGVLSHANDFKLEAAILPGPRVKLGDVVKFRIASEDEGQLLVLDTGPDGKLRRIYPNEYSEVAGREGRINAGAPLTIPDESYPFEFTATDAGPGTLMVLVAEPGTDFGALLNKSTAFEEAETPDKALIAIATQLQEPVLSPDPDTNNRARRWAFVTVPYHVGS